MSYSGEEVIKYEVGNDGLAILEVNRPQARNALNWAAQERFAEIVDLAAVDEQVRALIITGSGDNAFVSGGDLKELHNHPEREAGERLNRIMSAALARLMQLPFPVIAAVNGDAYGGGCEIMIACDLRMAGANTRFGFAQIKNALTTGWGGTARLVQLVGQSRALDLLLTGRMFTAQEAAHLGLIQRIVPAGEDMLGAAKTWAAELIAMPNEALAATKQLVYAAGSLPGDEVAELERQLFIDLWEKPNHLEALKAFSERRPPTFNQDRS
ncbi:MAG: enoyl-CoA hydratase/isomerase family protein [Candidatus Promineifilaceae bacterium]|nr:enoyl-CoA hydratase/isomerase family protein [Candidatus Promineifilaceae bacterium]